MAKINGKKTVFCYLCGHPFDVSTRAMTVNCPKCHKQLMIDDVTVKTYTAVTTLPSCGTIVVRARGRVVAKKVLGQIGVECNGTIEADIETTGFVRLGKKAKCKGAIRAGTLKIADGAQLTGPITVPWTNHDTSH